MKEQLIENLAKLGYSGSDWSAAVEDCLDSVAPGTVLAAVDVINYRREWDRSVNAQIRWDARR
jgi:hypothetical protein